MSWQGQFGDLIESLEFYETDEKRGFVRGARWGLAPTGGPINTALPSRAGEQAWGPEHHLHVRTHLGHGANWGLFAEDLPDEANHITLSARSPTRRGSRRRRSTTGWPTTRAGCSTSTSSGRRSRWTPPARYKIEVDRLMRYSGWHLLGTARMGDDPKTSVLDRWNRTPRRPEPLRRRRLVLRDVVRRQPDVDDRRDRAPGGRPHGRDALRAAGAGVTVDGAARDAEPTSSGRHLAAVADHLIPAAHGMPSAAEVVNEERLRFVLDARPDLVEPLQAALRAGPGRDADARLDMLARDEPASLGALQLAIVAGYYTDKRRPGADRLPRARWRSTLRSWECRNISKRARSTPCSPAARLARPRHRAASERNGRPADVRRALLGRAARAEGGQRWPRRRLRPRRSRQQRAGSTRSSPSGVPGTGEPREIREPATGRPLLTLPQSTPDDVARAAAAAAAAQPAWAETSYAERAAILRRAAEIYEAHRPEFGTWTQRETGAHRNKMHHEQNFAVGELHAAATMPSSPTASSSRPSSRAACRCSAASRPASSARSRRGTRRACWGCASSRRRSRSATRSSSSPIRRRRSAAGRCSRRSSARRACPTACSTSSSAAPRPARRSSPTRTSTVCRSPARPGPDGGSGRSRAGC